MAQRSAQADWEVNLVDLHSSAIVEVGAEDASLSGRRGTPEYSAPEVVIWFWYEEGRLADEPPRYGLAADIWSLGMTLHVMLTGYLPFSSHADDEEEMLREINAAEFDFEDPGWARLSADANDMVRSLLVRDPYDRPTVEEVLQHPFLSSAVQKAVMEAGEGVLKESDFDKALALLEDD